MNIMNKILWRLRNYFKMILTRICNSAKNINMKQYFDPLRQITLCSWFDFWYKRFSCAKKLFWIKIWRMLNWRFEKHFIRHWIKMATWLLKKWIKNILGKATDCIFHVYALTWKFSQKFQVDQKADFLSVKILHCEVPFG